MLNPMMLSFYKYDKKKQSKAVFKQINMICIKETGYVLSGSSNLYKYRL